MKKFRYVIVAPKGTAGGVIALQALCKYLNEQGEKATMFYLDNMRSENKHHFLYRIYIGLRVLFDDTMQSAKAAIKAVLRLFSKKARLRFPKTERWTPVKCKSSYFPRINKNTIVVYPEIIHGNLLGAKNVVRWLLWHNRTYKNENGRCIGYDQNDLFFCYREVFNDYTLNPECRKLHVAFFDFDTYKRYNYGERSGKCYFVRKGAWRSDLPTEFDGPVLDDLSEKEKVKIMNESEYCISYDTQTAYSQIAALCGCISVVVPEKGKTKYDYRKNEELTYGVAFGMSEQEIERAKATVSLVDVYYKNLNCENVVDVERFIRNCEVYFDNLLNA